jgi:UDP-N-acetyl-D-glucosamine dehydrogenase
VTIGIVGLGYTGLPLAVASAQAGFTTFGFDVDEQLCTRLNQGVSHITDVTGDMLCRVRATAPGTSAPRPGSSGA